MDKFCCRVDKKFVIEVMKVKVGKLNNLRICSVYFVLELYKRILNGRCKIFELVLLIIFKLSEKRSLREVCYELMRKKCWLNDDIKIFVLSFCVDINKENYFVKEVELVVVWSGVNV